MEITGTIKNLRKPNRNDWVILGLSSGQKVTGVLPGVEPGDRCRFYGRWRNTKFGREFKADRAVVELPKDDAGIIRYLSERLPWVGPEIAALMLQRFGADGVFKALDAGSEVLVTIPGITGGRAESILKQWRLIRDYQEVGLFLSTHQIGPALRKRLWEEYETDDAGIVAMLQTDPYALVGAKGIGFKTADRIGMSLEIDPNDPRRVSAAMRHVMTGAAAEGHCFLPKARLEHKAEDLLADGESWLKYEVFQEVIRRDHLYVDARVYLPELYRAEKSAARDLHRLMSGRPTFPPVDVVTYGLGDYAQERAVRMLTEYGKQVLIINGPPGTGKTHVIKKILEAHSASKALLASPTGKAARRMADATGLEAQTIHRLLEYIPGKGFQRSRLNPLKGDLFIIDETSMVDIRLMAALLEAIPTDARVVFLGDAEQLPSVEPGAVLRDMIKSGAIPCSTLTTFHRAAADSQISQTAGRINRGEPILPGDPGDDFLFIELDDPEAIAARIVSEASAFPPWEVVVLCPQKRGPLGTVELNKRLREAFNANGTKIPGTPFRLTDRIIQHRNNYDVPVFNGDLGVICQETDGGLLIEFEGAGVKQYPRSEINDLGLAYALTVHKAQGSEFPIVIMPIHRDHAFMLRRDLVYTAVTRARERCTLVGTLATVNEAIKRPSAGARHTSLDERIREEFNIEPETEEIVI